MRVRSLFDGQRRCVIALGALATPLLPSGAGGQEVPVAHALRAAAALEVDGVLEDDAWDAARGIGSFVQVDPAAGAPSRAPTDVRLLWDGAGLYVGAEMTEPDARAATRAEGLRRDFTYETSDVFGVLLDGFGDGRFAMAFMTTPRRGAARPAGLRRTRRGRVVERDLARAHGPYRRGDGPWLVVATVGVGPRAVAANQLAGILHTPAS